MHRNFNLRHPERPAHQTAATGLALAAVLSLAAFSGCQVISEMSVDRQLFNQNMIACTDAIHTGNLDTAEVHLAAARPLARTDHDLMQLRSLTALIAGAEAMQRGDTHAAAVHFSQIEDPHLRREVRAQARLVQVDVPLSPLR